MPIRKSIANAEEPQAEGLGDKISRLSKEAKQPDNLVRELMASPNVLLICNKYDKSGRIIIEVPTSMFHRIVNRRK